MIRLNELMICNSYKIDDREIYEIPASLSEYRIAKPVYQKLKGWKDIPDNIWDKGFGKLPREIKEYISFIEQRVNCNVTIVSVGPQRHETIIR